jgi:hypothetical protein
MESKLVRFFSRRSKGPFHALSVRNPITRTASASLEPILTKKAHPLGCYPAWRRVSGPSTLGIIGLAIAVALWGYSYKLSLYHRDTAPSARVPVAKLWIEPRGASDAAAPSIKAIAQFAPGSQAFPAHIPRLPIISRAVAFISQLNESCIPFFDLLIPSRAPPPPRFLLA